MTHSYVTDRTIYHYNHVEALLPTLCHMSRFRVANLLNVMRLNCGTKFNELLRLRDVDFNKIIY